MGRTREYVEREYGFPTDVNQNAVVINAATATRIFQNNPNRISWTIVNLGAAIAYLAFTSNAGAAFGMQLAATGGLMSMNARDDGEVPVMEIWALGAGASTLFAVETIAVR